MSEKKPASAQLNEKLGFNAVDRSSITDAVFEQARRELQMEREEEALKRAKDLLAKAVELARKKAKLATDFKKADAAVEKELGKVLGQLRTGTPTSSPESEGEDNGEEPTDRQDTGDPTNS
jgi:hypothetical protein